METVWPLYRLRVTSTEIMVSREKQQIVKGKAAASGVNLSHTFGISLQGGSLNSATNSQLCEARPYHESFFLKSFKLHIYPYNVP